MDVTTIGIEVDQEGGIDCFFYNRTILAVSFIFYDLGPISISWYSVFMFSLPFSSISDAVLLGVFHSCLEEMVEVVNGSEHEESQVALLFADDAITCRKNKECREKDSPYLTHIPEHFLFPVEESNANNNDEDSSCSDSSYDSDSSDDTSIQNLPWGIIQGKRSRENEAIKTDLLKHYDLPIDVQFSIPGVLILILYCIAR